MDEALEALRMRDLRFDPIDYRPAGPLTADPDGEEVDEWRAGCPSCATNSLRIRERARGLPAELICINCTPEEIERRMRQRLEPEARVRRPVAWKMPEPRDEGEPKNLDQLRALSSRDYIQRLTGREASHAGYVQCPFHAGGQERTPSLHAADHLWYCFGCERGGDILDFYAELHLGGRRPTGGEWRGFVDEAFLALGIIQ